MKLGHNVCEQINFIAFWIFFFLVHLTICSGMYCLCGSEEEWDTQPEVGERGHLVGKPAEPGAGLESQG